MICKELMGCRVYKTEDSNKKIIGKVIGHHVSDVSYFTILASNGDLTTCSPNALTIIKEDMAIIYKNILPKPIEDRFEIMDL
jgi:hypothetical protein